MATVKYLSYPGGPPGMAVRLDRKELVQQFWSTARRVWTPIPVLIVLLLVFVHLNTRPNTYGLLGALCICLILLAAFVPAVVIANLWMSTYYFDQRWIAWYRGSRRRSVDMTMICKITSRGRMLDGCWAIRSPKSSFVILRVPEVLLAIDEVRAVVTSALAVAARTHEVEMDKRSRMILGQPPFAASADDPMAEAPDDLGRPPLLSWPGMPMGINLRLRHPKK
jgi:hypothetical protein